MTKAELLLAAELLEMASDTYSNNGCNDYEIDNTPGNFAVVAAMEQSDEGWTVDDISITHGGTKIFTTDFGMMDHLAGRMREEAAKL